jgi:hypothetical protein
VVFARGIKVDPGKISAILVLEPPTNTQEVKKMWGKIGYYNRFIDNLAEIGRPITRLLSKQQVFNWTQECSTAFQYIKLQLSSNPVLYNPGWSRLFILNPSAGKHAIAYILLQNNASGRAHPIYYGSRLMSICEQKYTETEKQMVVLLYGCIKYKHYLITSNFPVEVQSPHEGLKAAMNQAHPKGRVFRFFMVLQQSLVEKRVRYAQLLCDWLSPATGW